MAYIDGIDNEKLVKYLCDFNRRLSDELSQRLDGTISPIRIAETLDVLVAEESIAYEFLVSDIIWLCACMEKIEEAEYRIEEAEKAERALRDRPELMAPEHGPEPLRWDARVSAFVCPATQNRFRLVRED